MEMYRTIKVKCLVCNTIIEANPFNNESLKSFAECNCENHVQLINDLKNGDEYSTIYAEDKTKVMAMALEDSKRAMNGEWFYVREPEDENTQKYQEWVGQTGGNYHAFCEGIVVKFFTEKAMTANTCRQLLKKEIIKEQDNHLRVYHFWQEYDEKFEELIVKEREKVLILKNAKTVTLTEIMSNKTND